ncbi:unnamed protein product [Leptosia nina]|uniref:C2H2-type domain-containing protein n=1 Tax=Leptosia nina TaxID=320188 RepID=A0AAV1K4F9_9NEOP
MDESSNEASVVAIDSDEEDDKPIKKLFKRLISNNCKQSTILTNNQILDLLKFEFDINIFKLHNLEIDIYITLMKRFLKHWPLWDEFDRLVDDAKKANNLLNIDDQLQIKYDQLKNHLGSVIAIAEPMGKEAVLTLKDRTNKQEVTASENKESLQSSDTVVLEIDATRRQLNSLIYRHPVDNCVFNANYKKTTITVPGTKQIEAILNWWDFKIEISCKSKKSQRNVLLYKREVSHELKHILVNKANSTKKEPVELNQEFLFNKTKRSRVVPKTGLLKSIDNITRDHPNKDAVREILKFIWKDLSSLPEQLYSYASYKRYMNKCGYIRYLFKDEEKGPTDPKYDLQLEETVSPMFKLYIGDLFSSYMVVEKDSLKVECMPCKVIFSGVDLISCLRLHFEEHCTEPDWTCTKCSQTFPMLGLAGNWWSHVCQE